MCLSHIHIHHLPNMHSVGITKPKLNSQALQHSISLREAEAPRQPHGRGQETLQGWGETPRGTGPPSTPQGALAPSRYTLREATHKPLERKINQNLI